MRDMESSALDDRHKALFRLMDKVNHDSPQMTPADLDAARAAGWSDEELYFAITVCALFNFYNKWIDATGVGEMPAAAYATSGERLALQGYAPAAAPAV